MAKSKSSTLKQPAYSKIKRPVRPKWMRALRTIMLIPASILMLPAIAGIIINYYRLVSKY